MMDDFYIEGKYLENNPTWHEEDSPWKASNIIAMIEKNHLDYNTICEVGCGAGEILNQLYYLTDHAVKFYGYEISPQAYNLCKNKQKARLTFLQKDIVNEHSIHYDILLVIDVLEHIENYYEFLKQIRKKGNYKIFHIPLDISVQSLLRVSPIMNRRRSVGHIHYFTKETALAALNDSGYHIIDSFYTTGSIDLPRKNLSSKLIRIFRKVLFSIHEDITVRLFGGCSLLVLAE